MSDTTSPADDWRAQAMEAMERQELEEAARAAAYADAEVENPWQSIGLLAVKMFFFIPIAYVLVQRYGIVNLVWLGFVFWYLVWPTITEHNKRHFK